MIIRRPAVALAIIAAMGAAVGARAQTADTSRHRVSNAAVAIASIGSDPSSIQELNDLAATLSSNTLRITPVVGQGPVQNIANLLNPRGADAAIVPSDVLPYLRRDGRLPGTDPPIRYVTKLDQEEVHVLARQSIVSVADLAGQKVNFDARDSRAFITGSVLFAALKVNVLPVSLDSARAVQQLRRGEIAALVYVGKKPARLFFDLNQDDGVHFVPVPATEEVLRAYLPARLAPADYPLLIRGGEAGRGEAVATVAVPIVLAVNNLALETERYRDISRLIDAPSLRPATVPQRGQTLTADQIAEVPGWRRAAPPLERPRSVSGVDNGSAKARPAAPREGQTSRQKVELAQQFLRWRQQRPSGEPRQSDPEPAHNQGGSGTSTVEATARRWDALFGEFVRWREEHPPAQRSQIDESVFEEILRALGKR